MFGVESVLDLNGNVFYADRVDGRRVDDLGAEVAQFHGLHVRQLVNGVSRLDDLRVGCHESVYVRPDFQHLGIQHCRNDGGRVVRAAAPQIRRLMALAVPGYEARHDVDMLVVQVLEGFLDQLCRLFHDDHVLALFLFRADEVT